VGIGKKNNFIEYSNKRSEVKRLRIIDIEFGG